MSEYLANELSKLGIDDEAIVEYCVGLLEDTNMDDEEKQEAIAGYLEATNEHDFAAVVIKAIELLAEDRVQQEMSAQEQAKLALRRAQEKEREELLRDARNVNASASTAARQLTAEERRQRERVLKAYDYAAPEIVEGANGEAELVYREQAAGGSGDQQGLERNVNAQIVADKERAQREANRAAHQKKTERDKELLERDKLRKEKEKRRTMKTEKRRM